MRVQPTLLVYLLLCGVENTVALVASVTLDRHALTKCPFLKHLLHMASLDGQLFLLWYIMAPQKKKLAFVLVHPDL